MRVLIVGPSNSPHCIRWVHRLIDHNIDILLLDMFDSDSEWRIDDGIQRVIMEEISPRATSMLRTLRKFRLIVPFLEWIPIKFMSISLKNFCLQRGIQLINIHWMLHPYAVVASKQKDFPVISTPWGSDVLLPHYQGRTFLDLGRKLYATYTLRKVVAGSRAFICDATHLASALKRLGSGNKEINMIYFGTDIQFFSSSNRDTEFRNLYRADSHTTVVLSNRGLDDIYEIWVLINAIPLIPRERFGKKVVFWFAGGGKDRNKLEALVHDLQICDRVVFLGRLPDPEFAKATASCDIYVSTSPTDGGLAASVAEAMACEKPVVVTNFGDNASWLENQRAGLLFTSGDEKELAQKILWLLENPIAALEMGKFGRRIIESKNNASTETKKIISTYLRQL